MPRFVQVPWDQEQSYEWPDKLRALWKIVEVNVKESDAGNTMYVVDTICLAPKEHRGRKLSVRFTIPWGLEGFRLLTSAVFNRQLPKGTKAGGLDFDLFTGHCFIADIALRKDKNDATRTFVNWTNYRPYQQPEQSQQAPPPPPSPTPSPQPPQTQSASQTMQGTDLEFETSDNIPF